MIARVDGLQGFVADAEPLLHVGPIVFHDDVRGLQHPHEHRAAFAFLKVER